MLANSNVSQICLRGPLNSHLTQVDLVSYYKFLPEAISYWAFSNVELCFVWPDIGDYDKIPQSLLSLSIPPLVRKGCMGNKKLFTPFSISFLIVV